jgi:myosin XVI
MEQRLKLVKRMRQEQIRRYYEREEADNKGTNLGKPDINKQGSRKVQFDGGYRLQDAVANYDEAEVARLVKEGVHSKVTLGNDRTLLHLSASHNFVAAAEILLEHNASVNAQDGDWWTPLHIAASNNSMEMCRVFISHNADPSILDVDGNFASDYATGQCKEMLLDFMLKRGMDKGVMKSLRMTVANTMMTAITKKMDEGHDFNTPNEYGVTSLHVASANGYKAVVQLLLQHQSVKVNADDDAGWTPLHVAAKWDQVKFSFSTCMSLI